MSNDYLFKNKKNPVAVSYILQNIFHSQR